MEEKILEELKELCEEENLTFDTELHSVSGWDSLAFISYVVFAKKQLHAEFEKASVLEDAKTVRDIVELTKARIK